MLILKRRLNWKPVVLSIAAVVSLTMVLLWVFLYLEDQYRNPPAAKTDHYVVQPKMEGIEVLRVVHTNTSDRPGQVIFDIQLRIKHFGDWDKQRLPIPDSFAPKHPQAELVFMGGSFTHGSGLKDEQTLPYQIQSFLNQEQIPWAVRCLARGGESFSNLYAKSLSDHPLFGFVLTPGVPKHFVYLHPSFHLWRTVLTPENLFQDLRRKEFPYFKVNREQATLQGSHLDNFPFLVNLISVLKDYKLLTNRSFPAFNALLRSIGFEHLDPSHNHKKHMWLLNHFGHHLKQRYPGSTFTVIEFPFFELDNQSLWAELQHPLLQVNLHESERHQKRELLIEHDGHPSEAMIELIAPRIYAKLKQVYGVQ